MAPSLLTVRGAPWQVPIHLHYKDKECDEAYDWCPKPPQDQNVSVVDPIARYMHYEAAYKAGKLDPAFEVRALETFPGSHKPLDSSLNTPLTPP